MSARSGRRLSVVRLLIATVVVGALAAGGFYGAQWWTAQADTGSTKPWFGGYVDVTATPRYAFEEPRSSRGKNVVLSFIVAGRDGGCTPTWGAAYGLDAAASQLDLDRRIARLRQRGGAVAVSFGGQANKELALTCGAPSALAKSYDAVLRRYRADTMDLDLEGGALTDVASSERRAKAVAELQRRRAAAHERLSVWVTLPVAPTGLTKEGTDAVERLLSAGVDLAGVNVMTMDYGGSLPKGVSMLEGSRRALVETHRQLGILYDRQKLHLSPASLWSRIGATPMIGQNDIAGEVFGLAAAKGLNRFARQNHLARVSMWSANRDATCGSNYVDVRVVSVACSGVRQGGRTFTDVLGAGFRGRPTGGRLARTTADPVTTPRPDVASRSPYPIWSATAAYLKGTKVTWHHNVYSAKWWTRGDLPDDPVLDSWQTPWQLVGPVLAGDTPAPTPSLPAGTFPHWSGRAAYKTGAHVLLDGVPYQAKWWNTGSSPAASSVDPDGSPWSQLTVAQALAVASPSPTTTQEAVSGR